MIGRKDEAGENPGLLPLLPFACMPTVPKQVPQNLAATLYLLLQSTRFLLKRYKVSHHQLCVLGQFRNYTLTLSLTGATGNSKLVFPDFPKDKVDRYGPLPCLLLV